MGSHSTLAEHWRAELRAELMRARKERDITRVNALRSALSAIDNAETPERTDVVAETDGVIAKSVAGLAAAEHPRRVLTDEQIRGLLSAEIAERRGAADQCAATYPERAEALRAEASVLAELLTGR